MIDFEADIPKPSTDEGELARITELAKLLLAKQQAVVEAEDALTMAKDAVTKIEQVDLPELMKQAGMKDFSLQDGTLIEVKQEVQCGISEERRPVAHAWLRANGFGGLIKSSLSMAFDREEGELAQAVREAIVTVAEREPEMKEAVHPATLKSFVKERMELGKTPPVEPFAIHPFDKAKVTLPKKKAPPKHRAK